MDYFKEFTVIGHCHLNCNRFFFFKPTFGHLLQLRGRANILQASTPDQLNGSGDREGVSVQWPIGLGEMDKRMAVSSGSSKVCFGIGEKPALGAKMGQEDSATRSSAETGFKRRTQCRDIISNTSPSREPWSNAQGPLNKEAAKAIGREEFLGFPTTTRSFALEGERETKHSKWHSGQLRFRSAFSSLPKSPHACFQKDGSFPARQTRLVGKSELGLRASPTSIAAQRGKKRSGSGKARPRAPADTAKGESGQPEAAL